jgi:hypothetical protein
MSKRKRQFVIAEGYPWYLYGAVNVGVGKQAGYYRLALMDGPNRQAGRKPVKFKLKWGAWKKVRILIEEIK